MICCPGTSAYRMHPIQKYNGDEVVVHNAHLQTFAPQLEVAILTMAKVCGGSGVAGEREKKAWFEDGCGWLTIIAQD
jgi:hypothetical protein